VKSKALLVASAIGVILQLAMVIGGHFQPAIESLFAIGGMGLSLIAGGIFAILAKTSWPANLRGGAMAGAACALIGIGVSFGLGDVPASLLALGTLSSAVTGAIGAALGKLLV
jgi:hypothetical protein